MRHLTKPKLPLCCRMERTVLTSNAKRSSNERRTIEVSKIEGERWEGEVKTFAGIRHTIEEGDGKVQTC